LNAFPIIFSLILTGCTLSTYEYTSCDTNATCQEAFGWGQVCGEQGLCEVAEVPNRCTQAWPIDLFNNREAYSDSVILGVNYDHSDFSYEVRAMELAIRQANEEGGIGGREFALIQCDNAQNADYDTLTQEEANLSVTQWLSSDIGVPGIIGPATSTRSLAAYSVAATNGSVLMSPSATSPDLTIIDGQTSTDEAPGLFWRTAPPDSLQGEVIGSFMKDALDAQRVAVIHEMGTYGKGLADAFVAEFTGDDLFVELWSFSTTSQRDEAIVEAGNGDFDQVLFIATAKEDLVALFYAAGQIESFVDSSDPMGIFLADGAYYIDIFEEAGDYDFLFEQVHGTRPTVVQGSVYETFSAGYAAAYDGESPSVAAYTAYAYDAAWLTLIGSAWAMYQEDEFNGDGLARGLRRVSNGQPLTIKPSSWAVIKANFYAGDSIDVTGASGSLDFDPVTGETSSTIEVWGVQNNGDGTYEFVTTALIEP